MSRHRTFSGRGILLLAAAIGLALVAGPVIAAIPNANGRIYACYSKSTGAARLINYPTVSSCPRGERLVSWSQQGPAGPQGAQGETGATGAKGTQGETGATGAQGPKGDPGLAAIEVARHTFTVPANNTYQAQVYCPEGKVALSGGYGQLNTELIITDSYALGDLEGWTVMMKNVTANPEDASLFVICAKVSGSAGIDWTVPRAMK